MKKKLATSLNQLRNMSFALEASTHFLVTNQFPREFKPKSHPPTIMTNLKFPPPESCQYYEFFQNLPTKEKQKRFKPFKHKEAYYNLREDQSM